jgi:hypothetical protein
MKYLTYVCVWCVLKKKTKMIKIGIICDFLFFCWLFVKFVLFCWCFESICLEVNINRNPRYLFEEQARRYNYNLYKHILNCQLSLNHVPTKSQVVTILIKLNSVLLPTLCIWTWNLGTRLLFNIVSSQRQLLDSFTLQAWSVWQCCRLETIKMCHLAYLIVSDYTRR